MSETFIAAAIQWAPAVHDATEGVKRAVAAVAEAAGKGARLIVFPETWLQGYPYWLGGGPRSPEFRPFYDRLLREAIVVPGPALEPIQRAAAQHGCTVVISFHERKGATLYNTQAYIAADGRLLGKHRKLMPTLSERLIWGMGDGSDLEAYPTDTGVLSGLLCFEHQMTLARYALCGLGVQVHASAWPGQAQLNDIVDASTRHLAFENGCFVIVAREVMDVGRVLPGMPEITSSPMFWESRGGSAIIGPDGKYLCEPVFDVETIVMAEIDLDAIRWSKLWMDNTGHYARPDVFQLRWDKRTKRPTEVIGESSMSATQTPIHPENDCAGLS